MLLNYADRTHTPNKSTGKTYFFFYSRDFKTCNNFENLVYFVYRYLSLSLYVFSHGNCYCEFSFKGTKAASGPDPHFGFIEPCLCASPLWIVIMFLVFEINFIITLYEWLNTFICTENNTSNPSERDGPRDLLVMPIRFSAKK